MAVENINWSDVLNDHVVEDKWQIFNNILFHSSRIMFP